MAVTDASGAAPESAPHVRRAPCASPPRTRRSPGGWRCAWLLVVGLLPWGTPAAAQVAARAWVEVEPGRPTAGAEFRLDVHVSGMLLGSLRVTEPAPPANLEFVSGPRLLPHDPASSPAPVAQGAAAVGMEAGTGAAASAAAAGAERRPPVMQQRVVSYTLRARRPGRYQLDGFLIGLAGRVVSTRETPIQVLEPPPEEAAAPAVTWELSRRQALVGETISLHLVLVRWDELGLPERIEVQPPPASRFEQYSGAAAIGEQIGPAGRGYRIPLATYLLTPSRAGRVTVAPAEVALATATGTATLRSEAVTVAVREAPPEIASSGAIGSLRAHARIDQRPHPEGIEVTVAISVEGSGNHRFIKLPEPRADGMTPLEHVVRDELVPHDSGYTGQVVAVHRYLATTPGRYRVEVPEFVSYDSSAGTVRRDPGLTRVIELAAPVAAAGAAALPPLAVDRMSRKRCGAPRHAARSYLLLLPGPLIGGCLAVARKRRRAALAAAAVAAVAAVAVALVPVTGAAPAAALRAAGEAERAYLRHDYAAAEAGYRAAWEQLGCHPALSYNLALTALGRGDDAGAVGWLRETLRRAPLDRRYRALLKQVERRAGLHTQHRPPPFAPPAVPFHALLLLAGCVVAVAAHHPAGRHALRGRHRRLAARAPREEGREAPRTSSLPNRTQPLLALLAVAASLAAMVLGTAVAVQARDIIVVGDTELRRIPHPDAAPWIPLPAGTTLEVRGQHREHLLVRTGYGLDAWVSREAVQDAGARPNVRDR